MKQTASRADVEQATLIAAGSKPQASACRPAMWRTRCAPPTDKSGCAGLRVFPNGYVSTDAKIFEIAGMLEDGAEEIDVVLNIGALKAGETE